MNPTLHYIYDPLCGWCYGAAPLIAAARRVLPVSAHGGGMMAGAARQPVTPQLRAHVMAHDRQIARVSGQLFGSAYFDGLLLDGAAVFDSAPPTAAILAAEQLAGRGLDMLAALQRAHYVEGRRIAEQVTLLELAGELGLDRPAFAAELETQSADGVAQHIRQTRELMARVGAHGFPTLLLASEQGWRRLELSPFYGRPQAFLDWLTGELGALPSPQGATEAAAAGCDINGCAL